jgi:glycine/betaine/sarcosine/D-proline reductase family selenoprotein B
VPVVQITAVPPVAKMVGINRALRGQTITNVLGDSSLPPEKEKQLRRRYVLRALEILSTDVQTPQMFSLEGVE